MRVVLIAIVAGFIATPSLAEDYASHEGVTLFTQKPCQDVLTLLDGDGPDISAVGLQGVVEFMAFNGMAWGFILGYDTARGGLHIGEQTTLMRLREACASAPDKTAFEILEQF
jgi:hypothetical protein